MIGFKIFIGIVFILLFTAMFTIMLVFERNRYRNIICWTLIFLVTNVFGFLAYLIHIMLYYRKRKSLLIKENEDDIYKKLISNKLKENSIDIEDDLFAFNNAVYGANTTLYNDYEFFNKYSKFKDALSKDIKNATKYVFIQINSFAEEDFKQIKEQLIDKVKSGVLVRFTYDCRISRKFKQDLKLAGVKIYKFGKYDLLDRRYKNIRNMVSIDGKCVYKGAFLTKKLLSENKPIDIANLYVKYTGDSVEDMDLSLRQDTASASGKYIEYEKLEDGQISNNSIIQFVNNKLNKDFELLFVKAMSIAKTSIQLQLESFIPTDSIMALLKYAVNSNIDVKLIVSLKSKNKSTNFSSRAYAKELALNGAQVYLYDGYINFNAIVIDNEQVLTGSYSLERNSVGTKLQNIVLIKDHKAVEYLNAEFEKAVNNSYRINDAKYMLLREKIFKNIV